MICLSKFIAKLFRKTTNKMEWVSMVDRRPDEEVDRWNKITGEYSDFAEVICKVRGEKIPRSMIYNRDLKVFEYDDCFQMELYQVTHWMPLPDPPKQR